MNKRVAIIAVSSGVFARSMGIGENGVIHPCRVVASLDDLHLAMDRMEFQKAAYSIERDAILMVVSHPDLPEVGEGETMPELQVMIYLERPETAPAS